MNRQTTFVALSAMATLLAASTALAQEFELFAVSTDESGYVLNRIALSPLSSEFVGRVEPIPPDADISGLTSPDGVRLYTTDRTANTLIEISRSTGAVLSVVALDQDLWISRRGLDFAPNGTLYGLLPGMQLRTIDTSTGVSTLVSDVQLDRAEALGFAADGTLYVTGDDAGASARNFYIVDPTSGLATLVAPLAPVATDVDFLAPAPDGFFYGADAIGLPGSPFYRIEPSTGEIELLGSAGVPVYGLEAMLPTCRGDLTGDNATDVVDFGVFVTFFGQSVTPFTSGDLDGDGDVDVLDFGQFAADFGCGT